MQVTSGQQMDDGSKSVPRTFFLDDLSVGQHFSSGSHTIDAAQIKAFAAQFDPQPFHLDGEAAKATLFGGLAASGWHTAAITMKLLVERRDGAGSHRQARGAPTHRGCSSRLIYICRAPSIS